MEEDILIKFMANEFAEPIPENIYSVELANYEMKQTPNYTDKTKMETTINFKFVVLNEEYRGRFLFRGYVQPYLFQSQKKGKNALWQITEGLLGREVLKTEENKLSSLLNKQCKVFVTIKKTDTGEFNNIMKFMKADTLLPALTEEEKGKYGKSQKVAEETNPIMSMGQATPDFNSPI